MQPTTSTTKPKTVDIDAAAGPSGLEQRVLSLGRDLKQTMGALLESLPGAPSRPQELVATLGIDKVLSSRFLKSVRHRDPMAVVHLAPGPEPMRRVVRAAKRHGTPADVIDAAMRAVDDFERLIRNGAGDRSALNTIISAWLPEARRQFELRRKQAAFRAMSELKGCRSDVTLSTVILSPSADGVHIDIVWVMGLLGLQRLRPDAPVKFATRRLADETSPRAPTDLDGQPIEELSAIRLDRFCDAPPAVLHAHRAGNATHYTLAGNAVGPNSGVDMMMAEVNLAEMQRFVAPELGRKGFVFAEVSIPSRHLLFDVLVHRDIYPGSDPDLHIYDTVLDGVADANDRARDIDRMDMNESISPLGSGLLKWRTADSPNHVEMMSHVLEQMSLDADDFRGYRCRVDYPIYGSQILMAFDPPAPPAAP